MSLAHDSRPGNARERARWARTWAALVPALMVAAAVLAGCDGEGSAGSAASGGPSNAPAGELRSALERLVSGEPSPGAEDSTWFSAETAGALRSVTVDSAGHATVDFRDLRPLIPNASSSAGSTSFLRELNSSVFGVGGVGSVEYRMEGSCDLFWEWLQYECRTITRAEGP